MNKLIKDYSDFSLWKISKKNISNATRFVLRVNYQHHMDQSEFPDYEFESALKEDLHYSKCSNIYAICNRQNKLIGVIRAMEWNWKDMLPIEKDFNVNLADFLSPLSILPKKVWHIGRFAIDQQEFISNQELRARRITILKVLLYCAFKHVADDKDSIAIAECDSKLFEKLRLFNICSEKLGEPKIYFGSLTVPIYNTSAGVKEFVELNKLLCYV